MKRTQTQEQVAALLSSARDSLGLTMAFLTRREEGVQTLEVFDSSIPLLHPDGATGPTEGSLCSLVQEGVLPAITPDLTLYPEAMAVEMTRKVHLRSYASVPVTLSDGTVYGTFCAAGITTKKTLSAKDEALLTVLASAAATIVEPGYKEEKARLAAETRFSPLLAAGGPRTLVQPIVDLATSTRVGVEALARFPREWQKAPDVCFAEAHSLGMGVDLELMALASAAAHLDTLPGYVAMNVSPGVVLDPRFAPLLSSFDLSRVLLEICEQDAVEDYPALAAVLDPLRAAGMRLAIDDVGAGFSSLRHIVLTSPDVLKLDRSVVTGLASDPVLTTLVRSMLDFASSLSAKVVAEGVETAEDALALATLGVHLGQGWHFGHPLEATDLLATETSTPLPTGLSEAIPYPREPSPLPAPLR